MHRPEQARADARAHQPRRARARRGARRTRGRQMATLGFVGLGVMGGAPSRSACSTPGTPSTATTARARRRSWLVDAGLILEDTPRAVAEAADVVFTMVTNTKALEARDARPRRHPRRACAGQGLRRHDDRLARRTAARSPPRSRRSARGCSTRRSRARRHARAGQGCRSWSAATPRRSTQVEPICSSIGPTVRRSRRERPGAADQDRDQPQPARADDRVQRRLLLAEKGGIERRSRSRRC